MCKLAIVNAYIHIYTNGSHCPMLAQVVYIAYTFLASGVYVTPFLAHIHHFAKNGVRLVYILYEYIYINYIYSMLEYGKKLKNE